jgi:hypothetical protein
MITYELSCILLLHYQQNVALKTHFVGLDVYLGGE